VPVLLGKGDGTFQVEANYGTGSNPGSVAAGSVAEGDFNGDSKPDLAVVSLSSTNVAVLLGNGDGTFQSAVDYAAGANLNSVAVGDPNRDGNLDLAVANNNLGSSDTPGTNISVLLGNGDGTFQAPVNYGAQKYPSSIAVGDFNTDGKLDLVVANEVSIAVNNY